jgi:hypothetical protein
MCGERVTAQAIADDRIGNNALQYVAKAAMGAQASNARQLQCFGCYRRPR